MADTLDCKQSIKTAEIPWEPLCTDWPAASGSEINVNENLSELEFLENETTWDVEAEPDLHLEALHGSDDCMVARGFCFGYPFSMDSEMPPETPQERHHGKLDTNILGNNQVRPYTSPFDVQDDPVEVIAGTLLSRLNFSNFTLPSLEVNVCFQAANAAVEVLLRHGCTSSMRGLLMDSHVQDLKTSGNITMELNVDACGRNESNDILMDTLRGKSTLTPDPDSTAMAKGHAHELDQFTLNKTLNKGGVRKKVNHNSKKRPSHWRRVALRQVFAGCRRLRKILRDKGNPIENMNDPDVKPFLQKALTTPKGWKVIDLEDQEVPDARIIEVALERVFPTRDWRSTPASETITLKRGGEYTLARWLPSSNLWPPCGQEELEILSNDCQAKTKKLKV